MKLRNNASIAYALTSLASTFDDVPGHGRIAAGVLSRAPGDGAPRLVQEVASVLGMDTVVVRTPHVEYHPGAIDAISADIEKAVAADRPVLILLDEAHGAAPGVLRAIASSATRRIEDQPCIILAISTSSAERRVSEQIAEGLQRDPQDVAMHRTAEENLRLVQRVLETMA